MNRKPPLPPLNTPAALIATWFGAGRLPGAPGTWGSLAALPVAAALQGLGGPLALAVAIAALFGVAWWATKQYLVISHFKDPRDVVVDEVLGQWIAVLGAPVELRDYALAVVLFRSFDILKLPPVNWVERKTPGALGVILDDVVAGTMALAVMLLVRWIAGT